jgi:hypothetical protein
MTPSSQNKWFNLITRRERWGLTWRGWLLVLLAMMGGIASLLLTVHPFLALNQPVKSSVLVVEGWMSTGELHEVADLIQREKYQMVYTTGGPLDDRDDKNDESNTFALGAARQLCTFGIPQALVQPAPCLAWQRDRTYSSAVALREWLRSHGKTVASLNVATEGAHARRTLLMYESAFGGNGTSLGVISINNHFYEPDHWWRYSEGIKTVISEGAAYLYVKLLFHPGS